MTRHTLALVGGALVMFGAVAFAQEPPAPPSRPVTVISGDWVGPLEFTDDRGRFIIPTLVTLTVTDGKNLSGDWVGLTASGVILRGTINPKGEVELRISMYGGAELDGVTIARERCAADATFKGRLEPNFVFRWTAREMPFDAPARVAREQHCVRLRNLVWTLQRADALQRFVRTGSDPNALPPTGGQP
jgi:hypothetical protein